MTYADKCDEDRYSTYRFYQDIRRKVDVGIQIGHIYPNVLDHVVLDDDDVDAKLIIQISQSYLVDDAAASIQRFASRCLAADKSEMMVKMMTQVLRSGVVFPKAILDVLLFSGAKLDPNDDDYLEMACIRGMNDDVQQAIENGHSVDSSHFYDAILSGNCDTIKLVFSAYRESVIEDVYLLNATVQSMELLLSLNIIQRGKHYKFANIPSFSVLQWILDHDVMEHGRLLVDIARNASCHSGHYFVMLRYLIEQRNFTVPRDILISMESCQISDLDVVDHLLLHGADVNAVDERRRNILECFPMLIRYWIDEGFVLQSDDANTLIQCISRGVTAPVLEMMIDKYELNVHAVDRCGYTAIHLARQCRARETCEMLIKHGASDKQTNSEKITSCVIL